MVKGGFMWYIIGGVKKKDNMYEAYPSFKLTVHIYDNDHSSVASYQ